MKIGTVSADTIRRAGTLVADFFIGDGAEKKVERARNRIHTAILIYRDAQRELRELKERRDQLGIRIGLSTDSSTAPMVSSTCVEVK